MSAYVGAQSKSPSTSTDIDNTMTIDIGGSTWGGWESISITRGIETVPSTFEVVGTERYPGSSGIGTIDIKPGSPCAIKIGSDTVLTGYIDSSNRVITPSSHTVAITGRSMLADLVDCSGFTTKWQLVNLTMGAIAKAVCDPFGIGVRLPDGDTAAIPNLSIVVTETGFEVLQQIAAWCAKLVYDDTAGNLTIANVGTQTHSSGIVEGTNVQDARGVFNLAECYTEIGAVYSDIAMLTDGAGDTSIAYVQKPQASDGTFPARADGQPRYRPLLIVSENGQGSEELVKARTQWEMARRFGRSQQITVTVDTWRDSAGTLWAPNYLIPVSLPSMKLKSTSWIVSSVNYLKDDQGTRAVLSIMPKEAFAVMPVAPFSYLLSIQQATSSPTGAGTSNTSTGS